MRVGLGIDTGGTFTDAVAVDLATGTLLQKAKSHTTREDLSIGIRNALDAIDAGSLDSVEIVSLSSTLATNAVVEGKGARVGLVIAVPDPETFALPSQLPASQFAVISGAHNPDGRLRTALDIPAAAEAIDRMSPQVDAFAISSYFSVANSEHEECLRQMVFERCSLPVVCGHELSQQLGMVERATTAALNARLLPLVRDLLDAVGDTLDSFGISAPLMVVKGDGSLTAEKVARYRPVDTVLSGPAASVVGACRLSGLTSAIVADMGGTTTDIAVVSGGMPEVSAQGALVGGWRTRVQALDVRTVGLGGDSRIRIDDSGVVSLGPDRALPLCTAAQKYSGLLGELRRMSEADAGHRQEPVFLTLSRWPAGELSDQLVAALELVDGSAVPVSRVIETAGPFVDLDSLVLCGHLSEIAVTPTDVLVASGEYVFGDLEASSLGVSLLASAYHLQPAALDSAAREAIGSKLAVEVAARALADDRGGLEPSETEAALLRQQIASVGDGILRASIGLGVPLVAVGAPVGAWFPDALELIDAELVIPKHSEVANAFGALAGRVIERSEARVKMEADESFAVITAAVRERYPDYSTARRRAEELASDAAHASAVRAGAPDADVALAYDEVVAKQGKAGHDVFVELKVVATASGRPYL